jgi:hypothetical protein
MNTARRYERQATSAVDRSSFSAHSARDCNDYALPTRSGLRAQKPLPASSLVAIHDDRCNVRAIGASLGYEMGLFVR